MRPTCCAPALLPRACAPKAPLERTSHRVPRAHQRAAIPACRRRHATGHPRRAADGAESALGRRRIAAMLVTRVCGASSPRKAARDASQYACGLFATRAPEKATSELTTCAPSLHNPSRSMAAPQRIGDLRVPIRSADTRAQIPLLGIGACAACGAHANSNVVSLLRAATVAGTWLASREKVAEAVRFAIVEAGIRHIDCAAIYGVRLSCGTLGWLRSRRLRRARSRAERDGGGPRHRGGAARRHPPRGAVHHHEGARGRASSCMPFLRLQLTHSIASYGTATTTASKKPAAPRWRACSCPTSTFISCTVRLALPRGIARA